jgi:alcohol dehydrogenase class IV
VRADAAMQFEFATAGRIVFGPGVAATLGREAAALGRRALVLTGGRPQAHTPLLRLLDDHHLAHTTFRVTCEPTTDLALEALAQANAHACELVIGIGGGSVIDTGKVVAALLTNGGDLMDYLEVVGRGQPLRRASAPHIAVPTTAGTGAEVTRNAVLGSTRHRVKVSMRSPFMLPQLALVDPELTYTMPPALTAATGLDALTQLLEAFVSRGANPLTDGVCREGLVRAGRALQRACEDGADRVARTDMCVASLCGGLALANAKLGAVHGLAGPFGGRFDAPHGAVCGRLLPFVTAANIAALRARAPAAPALERYAEAARLVTGNPSATPEDLLPWMERLCHRLQVPGLAAFGYADRDAEEVVAAALRSSSMRGNPLDLTAAELHAVLGRSR